MKRFRLAAALAAVVALTGCGSGDAPFLRSDEPDQAEESQSADAGGDGQSGSSGEKSGPGEPMRPNSDDAGSDTKSASEGGKEGAPNPLDRYFGGKAADSSAYLFERTYGGDAYFFQAPSKAHICAIEEGRVGCMSDNLPPNCPMVPSNGDYPEKALANAVEMKDGAAAQMINISDAAFANSETGVSPVLNYGEVLEGHGFQCTTNKQDGVICRRGSHGFQLSSKKYTVK